MNFTLGKSLKDSRLNRTLPVFRLLQPKSTFHTQFDQTRSVAYMVYFRLGYGTQINDSASLLQNC